MNFASTAVLLIMVRMSVIPEIMGKLFLTQASDNTAPEVPWILSVGTREGDLSTACSSGFRTAQVQTQWSPSLLPASLLVCRKSPLHPLNQTGQLVSRQTFYHFHAHSVTKKLDNVESSWNLMAHGDAREGKWRGNRRMEWVASTLPLYLGTWFIQLYCQQ
jgi:hypothetical protein